MSSVVLKTEVPGPKSLQLMERVKASTPNSLGHATPLAIADAKGALVTDVDGNTFIDFTGGIGTLNTGHCAPEVTAALQDQAGRYLHTCFMVLAYEPYVELAERLNRLAPGDHAKKTVLFNSGAEAVENAIKIARAHTGRPGVIVFDRAFHGRTMFALGLTGQVQPYKVGFGPFPGDIARVPYPYAYRCPAGRNNCQCDLTCTHALETLFRTDLPPDRVAAILVEPVLGEGGFVVPPASFLPHLRQLCDQHGILLIADEVQTGFGRTGKMFACEHWDVVPDLLVSAKSLGGGTPISAVTGRAEILDGLTVGSLGGTYGGNPLSCRAALAALDVLERDGLVARSAQLGERVQARLRRLQPHFPCIGEVRGLGCMIGMELVERGREPASALTGRLIKECMKRGLLLLKSGAGNNVVRTLMPLNITDEQADEAMDIVQAALRAIHEEGDPS